MHDPQDQATLRALITAMLRQESQALHLAVRLKNTDPLSGEVSAAIHAADALRDERLRLTKILR
ncbi:MAG: hypothetical protein K0R58_37, partial [Ramlibacter sp.]|nr:hypothetical protein [Ramlibacter sp.]